MPNEMNQNITATEKSTDEHAREIQKLNGFLKALMDNAFTYSLFLDRDAKILYYSDSLLSLTDRADLDTVIGLPILDAYQKIFTDKDFIEEASHRLARVMSGENDFFEDDTVVWPNGERRIYRIAYKRVTNGNAGFDGILIFSQDITAIRLEEAERRLNDLLSSTVLPCLVWDENGDAVAYNSEASRSFGFAEDLQPDHYQSIHTSLHPQYQPDGQATEAMRREFIEEVVEKGFAQVTVTLLNADKTLVDYAVTSHRISWLSGYRLVVYYNDLTEAKAREAKAKEAEERAKLMFDAMPFTANMIDKNFKIIDCNQEALDFFEMPGKEEYVSRFFDLAPETQPGGGLSKELAIEAISKAFDEGYNRFEWMHQKLNGELLPCEVTITRMNYKGEPIVIGYARDLREVIAALGEMDEANERTRSMLDGAPMICVLRDENNNAIDCNRMALEIFGASDKAAFLRNYQKNYPEYQPDGLKSVDKANQFFKILNETGSIPTFEWTFQLPTGEPLPVEIHFVRMQWKDTYRYLSYGRDLREYKRMMAETEEANERMKLMLDGTPLMCVLRDDNGNIIDCNQEALNLLGVPDKTVFCRNFYSYFPEFQPDGTRTTDKTKKFIEFLDEKGGGDLERTLLTPAGELIPVESTIMRIPWKNTYYYLSFSRDLREIRAKEKEIQESMERERRAEVQRETAQVSNKAKSQFLATMSHEIRTPLNAILGITEILLQNDTLPRDAREALNKIFTSGDLLLGIINDILDLSKIEAGKLELMPGKYEVASMIVDTVNLNIMRLESKPIEFKVQVGEGVPSYLLGDELRIKQILNNLLSNAAKYTDKGEVSLSVGVDYMDTRDHPVLVFCVKDTGQGMSADQIGRMFDAYSRFNVKANRRKEGTGLGLGITQNLVRLMSGEISVESQVGVGSVFTVRLPQEDVGAAAISKELADNLQKLDVHRASRVKAIQIIREPMPYGSVLIVDDMETNIYVAKGLMLPYQLRIDSALSGFEAIDKIKDGRVYDIIFMDHMMPDMDGIEATKTIRGLGYKHPIVALTANAVTGQAEVFLANGFDAFISKPIDMRQLNAVLNKLIRGKQTEEIIKAARRKNAGQETHLETPCERLDSQLAESCVRDITRAIQALENIQEKETINEDESINIYTINVHAMKSVLANIGEIKLSERARQLEQAGKARELKVISTETPAFLDALRTAAAKIRPPEESEICETANEDRALLREKLLVIQEACEAYDNKAAEAALAQLKQKTWSRRNKELLDRISEHLLHSDFQEAASDAKDYIDTWSGA